MTKSKQARFLVLAAAVAATAATTTQAAPLTWDGGGGDQFFGTAGNWDPNTAPNNTHDVFFPAQAVAPTLTPLWEAADSVLSVSIDNSGGYIWNLPRSANNLSPRNVTVGAGGLTISGGGTTSWGADVTTISTPQAWNIGTNTTLQMASGSDFSGSSKITKTGMGTLNVTASSAGFSGGWDIMAGKVTNVGGSATNIYGTGAANVFDTATLDLNILGGGSVSGGAITLFNGSTLSGRTGTPHTGQTLLSVISPSIAVGTVNPTSVIIKATTASETFRLGSAVTGGASDGSSVIRIQGPGEVHLLTGSSSSTAFLGTWKVESGGTVRAEVNNSLGVRNGNAPSTVELAGGTVRWAGTSSTSTAVTWTNPILVTASSTMLLDKVFHPTFGNSVVNASGAIGRVIGPITIGAHTLNVNVSSVVTGPTTAGAPIRMGGNSVTLTGDAIFDVAKPSGYDLSFATTTITDGAGSFGYTKAGLGWMTVSSATTYNGPTNVTGGTLFLNNVGALAQSSGLFVSTGATANLTTGAWSINADLGGDGTIIVGAGASTLTSANAIVTPGNSAGTLTITGSLALGANSSVEIEALGTTPDSEHDVLAVSSQLTGLSNANLVVDFTGADPELNGATITIITALTNFDTAPKFANAPIDGNVYTFTGGTAQVNYNPGSITLSNIAIPEPGSVFGLGLIALGMLRRRRRDAMA